MTTPFVFNDEHKYDLYHARFVIYGDSFIFLFQSTYGKKWRINPPSLTNKCKNIDFIKQQRATRSTTDNEDSSNFILSLENIDTSK